MEKTVKLLFLFTLIVSLMSFRCCSGAANQPQQSKKKGSSIVLPIRGNVFPIGYYYALVHIGNPPKPYYLDIDTGSDLTWLQCDAPCISCSQGPHPLYRPTQNGLVMCTEPICATVHTPDKRKCERPNDQCDYVVDYADKASSLGVLVRDVFPLRFTNGSAFRARLAFGCGYDQQVTNPSTSPTDGTLGLGKKSSIASQLRDGGLVRNVIGHCMSGRGGGYLFFGDDLIPSSDVVWTPMSTSPSEKHYSSGSAELWFGKQSLGVKGLRMIFDSGSTYTYLSSQAYQAFLSSVKKDLTGTPLKPYDDRTLPVCWKGKKPFKSIEDVKKYFKTVSVIFSSGKKAQLDITPETYLIITSYGNVCLGILNGSEVGLGNMNLIGDISFQDRLVIYDNEKQQIGWLPKDCNRLPNVADIDDDKGLFEAYPASMGICPKRKYAPDDL